MVVLCQRMYTEIEGNPKLGERWGPASLRWVRGWPPRNTPLPIRVTLPNLVVLGQTAQGLLRRSARKKSDPRDPPFKVSQGHRNRHRSIDYTHDFLLTFHSNHGPVSHRFRDKRRFPSKIANFSHPRVFNTPLKGLPWNWISTQVSEETRMMGMPDIRKSFKIGLAILIQYRRVSDTQPAIATLP